MLSSTGFETTQADGDTAMREVLAGKGLAVDAIVLDCKMPGEPSAQLALHAKQLRLPVVMISGSSAANEIRAGERVPATPQALPNCRPSQRDRSGQNER